EGGAEAAGQGWRAGAAARLPPRAGARRAVGAGGPGGAATAVLRGPRRQRGIADPRPARQHDRDRGGAQCVRLPGHPRPGGDTAAHRPGACPGVIVTRTAAGPSAKEERVSLLVVGSIAFDSIETPNGSVDDALGGSATHASYAASFFTKPRLVGVV